MSLAARRTEPISILQRERALRPDFFMVVPYLALTAFGVLMVYSASAPGLQARGLDPTSVMRRHLVFAAVGVAVFIFSSMIDMRFVRSVTPVVYVGSLVTLLLVLTPIGTYANGARRWVDFGFYAFQPSEFAKVAVVLALALLLSRGGDRLRWDYVGRALLLVALPALLIFVQPDLGTMLVFGFIALAMLFVGGTTWRQMAFLLIAGVVGAVGIFQAGALKEFQLRRLTAFLDPTEDLAATALYNQTQSEIAIGSGGFFGKGLFGGSQTNLNFVPEQSTDFIFTAIGEQLGFIGAVIVLGLFAIIIWRVLVAAGNGRDKFSQLVATGVAALLAFHIFVNVAMTMTLMPVTGLPLPYLSAGGSAFIAMSLALGLAQSVWMRRSPVPD